MVTQFRIRLYLLALLVMAGMCLLVYRLYEIQVVEHDYYAARVPGSKFESVRIPGIRGEIKDRNGLTLVDSTPNYELQFDLRTIVDVYKDTHDKMPDPYVWERFDRYGQKEIKKETDIVQIVEETVFPGLQDLGLLADYSANSMRVHYRSTQGVVPFTYRRDLSFREFARFAENNIGIPGVTVSRTGRRRYLYDSLACHILGYMNLADIDQVPEEKRREFDYYVGDDYGVMGVEKTMDHYLQGKPGEVTIEKNEKGRIVGEVSRTDAQPSSGAVPTSTRTATSSRLLPFPLSIRTCSFPKSASTTGSATPKIRPAPCSAGPSIPTPRDQPARSPSPLPDASVTHGAIVSVAAVVPSTAKSS